MEKTGMTRRIDELGRLVIPKEIRKNLRIKDNDQIEISVMNDKIILNKYDSIKKDQIVTILINCLRKILDKNILFTSRDSIIDYVLLNKRKLDNILLPVEIMNIIENRKEVVDFKKDDFLYTIMPLIINGDLYGSLIIYGDNTINDKDLEIIKLSKMFLENYLE